MADRERLAFELMLVHNLKAPLTGILAALEMMQDGDLGALSGPQQAAVKMMREQGDDMARMIDDLLELGRTESSAFGVKAVPLDPREFLADVRQAWQGRLTRLTSDVAPDVTDLVADVDVLRRVFDNLLMNALVHAGHDAEVRMSADRVGDSVRITVSDSGPGIPGQHADRIFEPFVTLGSGPRKTHGLGLAYCRAALAAMDGTIALVPTERGAAFAVDVPAAVVLTRQALEQPQ